MDGIQSNKRPNRDEGDPTSHHNLTEYTYRTHGSDSFSFLMMTPV